MLFWYSNGMSVIEFNEFQDEAGRKRLLDIAESQTTPQHAVDDIVRNSIGEEIDEITRIVRGESNEVYGIRTKQNKDVILRIGHWDKKTFEREAWAVEQAVLVGVPVPVFLAVGDQSTEGKPIYFCIQEKLQGTTLDTLLHSKKLSTERARIIVENAGEAMGKLHSISTTGWGYLTQLNVGESESLADKYAKVETQAERVDAALKSTKVPVPPIETILEQLETGLYVHEGNQRLVHGDFGPKHIFVDDQDNITGIIDWEQAQSADPVVELARWNFWFEKTTPLDWLRTGHDRVASIGDSYDERFRIAKLEAAIWTLMYFTYDSPVEACAIRAAQAISEATI